MTQPAQRLILFAATGSPPDQGTSKNFFASAVTCEFSKNYAFNSCCKGIMPLRSLSAQRKKTSHFFENFSLYLANYFSSEPMTTLCVNHNLVSCPVASRLIGQDPGVTYQLVMN